MRNILSMMKGDVFVFKKRLLLPVMIFGRNSDFTLLICAVMKEC